MQPDPTPGTPTARVTLRFWLDAVVVFLGAFLLFLIQPAYSKFILPWFGGVPLVWATALVFFQTALLGGYAYAHWLSSRLPPRWQFVVHGALLALSLSFLPVAPGETWKPHGAEAPTPHILLMMASTLGLPYLLLAATSPLVQAWIVRHRHQIVPYRLFSLSNLASLLGLLSYPFLIEPAMGLRHQLLAWAALYGVYCVGVAGLVVITSRSGPLPEAEAQGSEPDALPREEAAPAWRLRGLWVALAAIPSLLFLAVTQHLTLDVAPVPFLWVLPLVLYLFTFVICFEFPHLLPRRALAVVASLASAAVGMVLAMPHLLPDFRLQLLLVCAGLFLMMLFCHAELYARRPAPRHLTRFYLMTALGGALGGSFVGLVAHEVFQGYHEVYVGLAGCAGLAALLEWQRRSRQEGDFEITFPVAACVFSLALVVSLPFLGANRDGLRVERNFFGALRVLEGREHGLPAWRQLDHGSTKHGLQLLSHTRRCEAVAYYSADSAVGRVLHVLQRDKPSLRIGVIGLGVGTLAAYARPRDAIVFYEINPLMEQIAREDFTYLSECAPQATVRIGDARILLEQESPNGFDVLVVDAFSSDSIPTHLLTREAFAVYASHLKQDGVMLVNISNRYLDLRPVVRAGSERVGLQSTFIGSSRGKDPHVFDAVWALLEQGQRVSQTTEVRTASARTPQAQGGLLWTDDFSNLFRLLQR